MKNSCRMCVPLLAFLILLLLPSSRATHRQTFSVMFRDVTKRAGINFTHTNGAFGRKYLPETLGPGAAFFDYNNDGWPDIFLVNGTNWPGHESSHATPKLYRNNHDGTFTDVTREAGLDVELFGLGVAVADYDNDGNEDLFITTYGQNRLFHNNGNGTFSDVTQKAGLGGQSDFSSSAAWIDFDRDGHLDLVVGSYVRWSPENDLYCTLDGTHKSYCTPESYTGTSVRLWHNRGDGTFQNVTRQAGLNDESSKTLGVAVLDYDSDEWPDLFFSNDTQPNKLYHNNRNGTFTESSFVAGVAFSEDGTARAGMGVDVADYDRTGHPSIMITNFSNQMLSLYRNVDGGLFVDEAPRSEIGRASLTTLGFGCFFFDYDLDGWPDIFVADGHIENEIQKVQPEIRYAEPPHLFRNLGNGHFEETTAAVGDEFGTPVVGRGAAYADFNNDGRLDVLVTTNGGPVHLFENDAVGQANRSLRLKLVGTKSNRDGLGATVRVTTAEGTQTQTLHSGSSYLSASELVLTFGIGQAEQVKTIEIRWPSGQIERLRNIDAGQTVTITEGKSITSARPYNQ